MDTELNNRVKKSAKIFHYINDVVNGNRALLVLKMVWQNFLADMTYNHEHLD